MSSYKIYCGGEFIQSATTLQIKNPFDNSIVDSTFLANEIILNTAIEKALSVNLISVTKFSYTFHTN